MSSSNLLQSFLQCEKRWNFLQTYFLPNVGSREGRAERRALAQQVEQLREELAHLKHSYQVGFRSLCCPDFHPWNQCIHSRNCKNSMLSFISRSKINRSTEVIIKLYLALVRAHLIYAMKVWSPYYEMEVNMFESLQRKMTAVIHWLRNLPSMDTINHLKLLFFLNERCIVTRWVKGFNERDINKVNVITE